MPARLSPPGHLGVCLVMVIILGTSEPEAVCARNSSSHRCRGDEPIRARITKKNGSLMRGWSFWPLKYKWIHTPQLQGRRFHSYRPLARRPPNQSIHGPWTGRSIRAASLLVELALHSSWHVFPPEKNVPSFVPRASSDTVQTTCSFTAVFTKVVTVRKLRQKTHSNFGRP